MTINSSINALFESANRAHQDVRLGAALEDYDRVLAQAPAHVGALYPCTLPRPAACGRSRPT